MGLPSLPDPLSKEKLDRLEGMSLRMEASATQLAEAADVFKGAVEQLADLPDFHAEEPET